MKGSMTFWFFLTSNPVLGLKRSAAISLQCVNDQTKHTKKLFPAFIITCSVFLGFLRKSKTLRHSRTRKRKSEGLHRYQHFPIFLSSSHDLNVLHKEYWFSLPSKVTRQTRFGGFHIQVVLCSRFSILYLYCENFLSLDI